MDNKISSLTPFAQAQLPSLTHLDLSNNRISNLESLSALVFVCILMIQKHLPSLQYLNLLQCQVAKNDKNREAIFDMLPSLVSLDFKDREGNEVEYSDADEDDESDEYEGAEAYDSDDDADQDQEDDGQGLTLHQQFT